MNAAPPETRSGRRLDLYTLGLAAVLALAAALRLYGITFRLPYLLNSDETEFVSSSIRMLAHHDPNPHWFGHPGTTTMELLALIYCAVYAVGHVLDIFPDTRSFVALYARDPSLFYLAGRLVSLVFGLLGVALTFKLGELLEGKRLGLIAALFVALSPLYVSYSQLVRTDEMMSGFLLAALVVLVNPGATERRFIFAGILTGLGIATKYPSVLFLATIVAYATIATRLPAQRFKNAVLGCAGAGLTVLLVTPFLFFDWRQALRDVAYEGRSGRFDETGAGFFDNLAWYFSGPMLHAIGGVGFCLALIGIGRLIWRRDRNWIVFLFPALLIVFFCFLHLRWPRWVIPIIPYLALLAALGIEQLNQTLRAFLPKWFTVAAAAGLVVLAAAALLVSDISHDEDALKPRTQEVIGVWMLSHLPRGARVLEEHEGPQLPKDAFRFFTPTANGDVVPIDNRTFNATIFRPHFAFIAWLHKPAEMLKEVDYVVVNDAILELLGTYRQRYPIADKNERQLLARMHLLYHVEPDARNGLAGSPQSVYAVRAGV